MNNALINDVLINNDLIKKALENNLLVNEVSQAPSLQLLEQGLELMLYGMGVVFVFLAALVTAITFISFIIHKLWPNDGAVDVLSEQNVSPIKIKNSDTLLKVLQKAIDQHRNRH